MGFLSCPVDGISQSRVSLPHSYVRHAQIHPEKAKTAKEELFDEIGFERNNIKREVIVKDL